MMSKAALLKAILENVSDSVIVIDHLGSMISVNPAVSTLFGYAESELLQQNVSMLMQKKDANQHDDHPQQHQARIHRFIIGKSRKVTALKKDGSIFPIRIAVSEARYKNQVLYAGIIYDLTQEKEKEDTLIRHNLELESMVEERTSFLKNVIEGLEKAQEEANVSLQKQKEVNLLKTRFVSMASHEFRTPLTGIQLSASLIEHYYERLDKLKIFSHLRKIKAGVGDLTALLDDFLSVERIDMGKVKASYSNFDLREICLEIIEEMSIHLKKDQQLLYEHLIGNTEICLDHNLLRHCIINLLSNAIKYSGENSVVKIATEVSLTNYYIRVSDSGIGIPKNEHVHLFEAFFRAQNTNDIQGTGLGLNIVKRYAELMNGSVTCESQENTGSVFTLIFPLHQMERKSTSLPEFDVVTQEY